MCRDPFRRRERSPDRRSSSPPSQHPRRRRDFYRDYDFPSPHHSRRRCTSVRAKPLEKMSSPLLSNDKRSAAQREELSRRARKRPGVRDEPAVSSERRRTAGARRRTAALAEGTPAALHFTSLQPERALTEITVLVNDQREHASCLLLFSSSSKPGRAALN